MKKQNLGLLIGGGLCGVGIFLFLYMGFVVATDYPNLVVLISGEQLSPGGSVEELLR